MRKNQENQKDQKIPINQNTEVFEYNNNFYHIPKDRYEIREIYMERVWFILNKLDENKSLDEIIRESRIHIAEKVYGCKY